MDVKQFWKAVLMQNADAIRTYFHQDAFVNWHNTNEQFTVEEFIRANCEYPGEWDGKIERVVIAENEIITATHVYSRDKTISVHVTSFIHIKEGKIASMDEYWGDDGEAPRWRQEMHIGRKIAE